MSVAPEDFNRRSFVYPKLVEAGAEFAEIHGAAVALRYPRQPVPELGLVDLSPLERTGMRGPAVPDWLAQQGLPMPEPANRAAYSDKGVTILRLGQTELMCLCDFRGDGQTVARLEATMPGKGVWHLPHQDSHFWFMLYGPDAVDCLHKICGVDLRPQSFGPGSVAQTSVARVNAVVCRPPGPDSELPFFHILGDSASALWFWDMMLDTMQEFGGGPLGLEELPEALRPELARSPEMATGK